MNTGKADTPGSGPGDADDFRGTDAGDVWRETTDEVPRTGIRSEQAEGGPAAGAAREGTGDGPGSDTGGADAGRPGGAWAPPGLGSLFGEARSLLGVVRERMLDPIRDEHPEVLSHLTAAGGELLAAYRAAVVRHERQWSGPRQSERVKLRVEDDAEEDTGDRGGNTGDGRGAQPGAADAPGRGDRVVIDEDDADDDVG